MKDEAFFDGTLPARGNGNQEPKQRALQQEGEMRGARFNTI